MKRLELCSASKLQETKQSLIHFQVSLSTAYSLQVDFYCDNVESHVDALFLLYKEKLAY